MHVIRHPPPIDFVVQLTNHHQLGFDAQTKESTRRFWCPNHQIGAADFEAQIGKPSILVLRPNQETRTPRLFVQGVDRTRRHPDLLIIRSLSTWPVLDYLRPSVPGLLLLSRFSSLLIMTYLSPIHYETSKHDSPHKIYSSRTMKISQIWI
jgi:hypothetical protein